MHNIVILGTGMAGFGATHRLYAEGITPVIYDKNAYYGGHTASFRYDTGFLDDLCPHISFTKDPAFKTCSPKAWTSNITHCSSI
jgi:protoporphyrinogen oxidase